jgi:hypothetical protein
LALSGIPRYIMKNGGSSVGEGGVISSCYIKKRILLKKQIKQMHWVVTCT